MVATLQALGLDRLTRSERVALAQAIWDSVDTMPEPRAISADLERELDNRLAEHAANPDDVVSWDEIKTDALKRFQQ